MTRGRRIALISAGAVILLLAIAVVTGVIVVRSGWLREKIRERAVSAVMAGDYRGSQGTSRLGGGLARLDEEAS